MFIDTAGLLCLHHAQVTYHDEAVRLYEAASARLTHSYVLAEYVALANARGFPRPAVLAFVDALLDDPEVKVAWVDEILHRKATALLHERLDKSYSLCDAVSFVLMRMHGIQEALTTDRHFAQEGFVKLLG